MRFPARLAQLLQSSRLIFAVAVLDRLVIAQHFLRIGGMNHQWLTEFAGVGRSLVLHHAFAGAYRGYDGPTAWLAPGYAFLVAAVFWICGIATQLSAVVLLSLNALFSSLTAVLLSRLGREYFSARVGWVAAWAWALSPEAVFISLLLWDTSLSALLLVVGLLVTLNARSLAEWARAGFVWGVAALVNPTLLAPLPFIAAALLWKSPQRTRTALVFALVILAVLLPWSIRNYKELHAIMPIRSNFWAEIYFGNVSFDLHPYGKNDSLYQRVGEIAFCRQLRQGAIAFITDHPGQFVQNCITHALRFWLMPLNWIFLILPVTAACWIGCVLAVRNLKRRALPFVSVLAIYPLTYAVTHVETRYRHPVEPLVYILASYAVIRALERSHAQKELVQIKTH